jgi:hypothetical protein
MDSSPTTPNYQQVTVDVPDDRLAEFHALFARFLAGRSGRGRRGRHGGPHHGMHGHRCAGHRGAEDAEQTGQPAAGTTEV